MSYPVDRPEASDSSAWVESPLQLLSVIEARSVGVLPDHVGIRMRRGVPGLEQTRDVLHPYLPLTAAETAAAPCPPSGTAGTWAIGDAFSGRVQRALLKAPANRIVIVDDGLATWRLLRLLSARRALPLVRARARPGLSRIALGLYTAHVLRRAIHRGRLTVFTMLPVPDEMAEAVQGAGIRLVGHDFATLRGLPARAVPGQRRIVLGTALVNDGLIDRGAYLSWLADHYRTGPIAYHPHRREDREVLSHLEGQPNVKVVRPGVPVEVSLRGLGPGHTVITAPSTVLASLPHLVNGAEVRALKVPEHWWTRRAGPGLRADLLASVQAVPRSAAGGDKEGAGV